MKIKKIDFYITRQFIATFFFAIIAFSFLFVAIDMMERLDKFIDYKLPKVVIVKYYLFYLPEIIRLITPVSLMLAALFVVGKLANQNELAALKSAGMSFFRFSLPFIGVALIFALFSTYFGGYIAPEAYKRKIQIEKIFFRKHIIYAGSNIFFQDRNERIVSIAFYDVEMKSASRVTSLEFDSWNQTKIIKRIDANRMSFDTVKNYWIMYNVSIRKFDKSGFSMKFEPYLEIKDFNFGPNDVIKKQKKYEDMTLEELRQTVEELKKGGINYRVALIEYHSRFAFAFANIIVVLFALPISANKRKSGLAIQFGINLLISFLYLTIMKISQAFGKNGLMEPLSTAWSANFVFLLVAIFYLFKAPR